jgi:hypothetical protein
MDLSEWFGEGAAWQSPAALSDHFQKHGAEVGAGSIADYDRSARRIIAGGVLFRYFDPDDGEDHIGYYEPGSGLFTAVRERDLTIRTHFRADPDYIVRLPDSTYE